MCDAVGGGNLAQIPTTSTNSETQFVAKCRLNSIFHLEAAFKNPKQDQFSILGTFAIGKMEEVEQVQVFRSKTNQPLFFEKGNCDCVTAKFWTICFKVPEERAKKSPWKGMKSFVEVECVQLVALAQPGIDKCLPSKGQTKKLSDFGVCLYWHLDGDTLFFTAFLDHTSVFSDVSVAISMLGSRLKVTGSRHIDRILKAVYKDEYDEMPWLEHAMLGKCQASRCSNTSEPIEHFFDEITYDRKPPPNYVINTAALRCKMLPYQKAAVRWMIDRELNPELDPDSDLLRFFTIHVVSKGTHVSFHYFKGLGIFTSSSFIDPPLFTFRGGILADEMGLGKTIEVLALLATVQPQTSVEIQTSVALEENDVLPLQISPWVDQGSAAGQTSAADQYQPSDMLVYNAPSSQTRGTIVCEKCGVKCFIQKVNWKPEYAKRGPFWCPQCMVHYNPLEVSATLIVVPPSLVSQWRTEIQKHLVSQAAERVLFYKGVWEHGYLQPYEFDNYDIVITTYNVFERELNFVNMYNGRFARKRPLETPKYAASPLTHVKWWRLCADEAQMVEYSTYKCARMCTKLLAHSRWCISGTPVTKAVGDLNGILNFFGNHLYNIDDFWLMWMSWPWEAHSSKNGTAGGISNLGPVPLVTLMRQLMWRNTKVSVANQVVLPNVAVHVERLTFFAIEELYYKEEMAKIRASLCLLFLMILDRQGFAVHELGKVENGSLFITQLSGGLNRRVMQLLTSLKESLISGGHTECFDDDFEKTATAASIILILIRRKKTQIENSLRTQFASLNALAGLSQLLGWMGQAPAHYIKCFQLLKKMSTWNRQYNDEMRLDPSTLLPKVECGERRCAELGSQHGHGYAESDLTHWTAFHTQDVAAMAHVLASRQTKKDEISDIAHQPIRVDPCLIFHTITNFKRLMQEDRIASEYWKDNGKELEDEFKSARISSTKLENNQLKDFLVRWSRINNVWAEYQADEMEKMCECLTKGILKKKVLNEEYTADNKHVYNGLPAHLQKRAKSAYLKLPFTFDCVVSEREVEDKTFLREALDQETGFYDDTVGVYSVMTKVKKTVTRPMDSNELVDYLLTYIKELEAMRIENQKHCNELFCLREMCSTGGIECIPAEKYDAIRECKHGVFKTRNYRNLIDVGKLKCTLCALHVGIEDYMKKIGHNGIFNRVNEKTLLFLLLCEVYKSFKDWDGIKDTIKAAEEYFDRSVEGLSTLRSIAGVTLELVNREVELSEAAKLMQPGQRLFVDDGMNVVLNPNNVEEMKSVIASFVAQESDNEKLVESLIRELRYLVNVANTRWSSLKCPVCHSSPERSWVVFPCAHIMCQPCYGTFKTRSSGNLWLACVICRLKFGIREAVTVRSEDTDSVVPGCALSTKMKRSVTLLRDIMSENETNKIIVFTMVHPTSRTMKHIQLIFKKAKIPFTTSTSEFTCDPDKRVLLSSMRVHGSGLNLTQANHIVFLDPCHVHAMIMQAVGRINRLGQTREMHVHHLIIADSIEEELYAIANDNKARSVDEGYTVDELRQVFGVKRRQE